MNHLISLRLFTTCFFLLFLSHMASSQHYLDSLNLKIQEIIEDSDIPGLGLGIVGKDQIYYINGFGYADQEQKKPYTAQTIQNIGSISKTSIAFVLMKMVEGGKLQLDAPIHQYLPFAIQHPRFPEVPIRIRHLATHTSSLTDGKDDLLIEKSYLFRGNIDFKEEELPEDYYPYFQIYQKNKEISIEQFLYNAYDPDGAWYHKRNFLKVKPGSRYHYSNLGATLLAYILEQVSGKTYAQLCQEYIFEPLGMQESTWSLSEVPAEKRAQLYLSNALPIPPYQLITYPDGGLYTSIEDFALYLREILRGINGESQCLSPDSYQEMTRQQLTPQHFPEGKFSKHRGLFWALNAEGDNIYMDGADPGIGTYTILTKKGNMGIVLFMNISSYGNESISQDLRKIRGTIFQYAGKLRK